jgi:F0F1-type ATP synthase assembly protein I
MLLYKANKLANGRGLCMKKLLKNPELVAIILAFETILISYITNGLSPIKDFLAVKNIEELKELILKDRIVIALFIFLLLQILWFTYQQVKQQRENTPTKIDPTIRPRILDAEASRVNKRLKDSLHNLFVLDLQHEERPESVDRKPLPTLYTISANNTTSQPQVIDKMVDVLRRKDIGGRLLILGQPGGGKTTTLLELAEELIDTAINDKNQPIPIILELSGWRDESVSILEWLGLQLKQKYNLAPGISKAWLEQGKILPLLDGLDELGLEKQRKCIQAINKYLDSDATRDLVICCREEEYKKGNIKLSTLHGAICLQELSDKQIKEYLNQFNKIQLWQSIQQNSDFLELARTPLFLSMMIIAYKGKPIQTQQELFAAYIDRRFELKPIGKGETSYRKTIEYLTYLAKRLKQTQTEFLIENIQSDWLQNQQKKWVYKLISEMIIGLIIGLIGGLIGGLIFEIIGLIGGLIIGLIGGLIVGLIGKETSIEAVELIKFTFTFTFTALKRLIVGLIVGLLFGLLFGLFYGLIYGLILGTILGLIYGLILGLISGLKGEIEEKSIPNQGIWNSVKNMFFLTIIFTLITFFIVIWIKPFLIPFLRTEEITLIERIILLLTAFLGFLLSGGEACIKHFSLRLVLWFDGCIPWNYASFLGYAVNRRIIQQVGGRYRFVHRLLLEHFANM